MVVDRVQHRAARRRLASSGSVAKAATNDQNCGSHKSRAGLVPNSLAPKG